MTKMKQKPKIFENGSVKESLERCLSEGYFPANLEQAWNWRRRNQFLFYLATSTLFIDGKVRDATLNELRNIEKVYERRGRLLFISDHNGGFGNELCYLGLNGGGCFLGYAAKNR